jgi:hypothetical protein
MNVASALPGVLQAHADVALATLIGVSDSRERTLQARLEGWREGHIIGYREGIEAGRAQYAAEVLADVAAEKRLQHDVVAALRAAAPPAGRWHLCCRPCRRGGHRPGCRDCQDRTRETFADPMPGDYQGGPVAWLPGMVPGSGELPSALGVVA